MVSRRPERPADDDGSVPERPRGESSGSVRDFLEGEYPSEDLLVMDGFDHCILGICEYFGGKVFVVYDHELVMRELESQGMTRSEAEEYWSFNQIGAWMGEGTPGFVRLLSENPFVNGKVRG